MTTTVMALPSIMDPMYWLGEGGLFASAVLPGILVIVFIETGLLFPLLPGDSLLFTGGLLAAAPNPPVNIWVLVICVAVMLGAFSLPAKSWPRPAVEMGKLAKMSLSSEAGATTSVRVRWQA